MRLAALFCAAFFICSADARMYRWTNPNTGTVQLSGTPPSWYRASADAGPRVLVYQDGKLVDDTARAVAPERSQLLRKGAFREVEKRKQLQALRKLEQVARWRSAHTDPQGQEAQVTGDGAPVRGGSEEPVQETADQLEEEMQAIKEKMLETLKMYERTLASEQVGAKAIGEDVARSGAGPE